MNLREACSSFSQLCSVLAGFCIAFVVLLFTPAIFPTSGGVTQDWAITLVFLSATLYIISAAIFANATRFTEREARWSYNVGVTIFHLSNTLNLVSLKLIVQVFAFPVASLAITGILVFSITVFVINVLVIVLPHIRQWYKLLWLSPGERQHYLSLHKKVKEEIHDVANDEE